jgi:hypothetical protein
VEEHPSFLHSSRYRFIVFIFLYMSIVALLHGRSLWRPAVH